MGLRDIGATLPPGFRFYPSDEELVCHYLCKKITNEEVLKGTLVEIDLHTCEPWQLPGMYNITGLLLITDLFPLFSSILSFHASSLALPFIAKLKMILYLIVK